MEQEDEVNISMRSTLSASPTQDSSEFLVLPGIPSHGTPTLCWSHVPQA